MGSPRVSEAASRAEFAPPHAPEGDHRSTHQVAGPAAVALAAPSASPPSFASLYEQHGALVRSELRRRGVPEHAVDDVAQEVFVTAYRKRDTLHGDSSARAWLCSISRFCAANFNRSGRRTTAREAAFGTTLATHVGPHDAERLISRSLLQHILHQLDEGKREAWVLTEAFGMTVPEICQHLDLPQSTVRSRLYGARRRLRGIVEELDQSNAPALEQSVAALLRAELRRPTPHASLLLLLPLGVHRRLSSDTRDTDQSGDVSAPPPVEPASAASWFGWTRSSVSRWLLGTAAAGALVAVVPWPGQEPEASPATVSIEQTKSSGPSLVGRAPSLASTLLTTNNDPDAGVPGFGASTVADPQLAAELALLQPALAAQRGHDFERALVFAEEHAERFPQGQLAAARALLHVQLLCALDRRSHARRLVDRYAEDATTAELLTTERRDVCRSLPLPTEP